MSGSEDERPDAAGIRPLKAAIHGGRVYLDMVSLVEGYRARADALEERGFRDVARLYRREADELDTAAIGWLTEGSGLTELPPAPADVTVTITPVAAALAADYLARHENPWVRDDGAVLVGTNPDGSRTRITIHVQKGISP